VLTNAGARPGDALILTKPLGTGIIATAIKFDRAPAEAADAAARSMCRLNRAAAEALARLPPRVVHACTDVTGFGLIGHASEMAKASGVTIRLEVEVVPAIEGARALALANRTGGGGDNEANFGPQVAGSARLDDALAALVYDPQTSGGLLVSLDAAAAGVAIEQLREAGEPAVRIGRVEEPSRGLIVLA
jgi:selenide,water dikinase